MESNRCKICLRKAKNGDELCGRHKKVFLLDSSINGYRLKKRGNGSSTRYIKKKHHSHEIELTKIIESFYGPNEVVTSYHPLWAVSLKGALLEYDIYVPSQNLLIEYNGIQHYKYTPFFHKTKVRFIAQQKRDKLKQNLARIQGHTLVTVRYDEPLVEDYILNKIERCRNGN